MDNEKSAPHSFPSKRKECFPGRLREAMGDLSMRAFAKLAGLSDAVIHSYLHGDTYPTLDRLENLAVAAGRDPVWFLGVEPNQLTGEVAPLHRKELKEAVSLTLEIEQQLVLSEEDRTELIVLIYQYFLEPDVTTEEVLKNVVVPFAGRRRA